MKELQLLLLILKSEENLEIPGVLELLLLVEAKNLIELSGSSTYSEELKKIILSLGKMFTDKVATKINCCLLYTSPSPRDRTRSRMPSSA